MGAGIITLIIATEEDTQTSDNIDSNNELHVCQAAFAGASSLEDVHIGGKRLRMDGKIEVGESRRAVAGYS